MQLLHPPFSRVSRVILCMFALKTLILQGSVFHDQCCLSVKIVIRWNLAITKGLAKSAFAITRFRRMKVLFHTFYYCWGKEDRSLYRSRTSLCRSSLKSGFYYTKYSVICKKKECKHVIYSFLL